MTTRLTIVALFLVPLIVWQKWLNVTVELDENIGTTPVIFTMVCGKLFEYLPELIGSIHRWRILEDESIDETNVPLTFVYGLNLSPGQMHQIALWSRIIYQDVALTFPPIALDGAEAEIDYRSLQDGRMERLIRERFFQDHRHYDPIYVDVTQHFSEFFDGSGRPKLIQTILPPKGDSLACLIWMRSSLANFHLISRGPDKLIDFKSAATRIAIGIAATSKGQELVEDLFFLKSFLPSFLRSINDDHSFDYILLLGYDAGDRIYDVKFKEVEAAAQAQIASHENVKFHGLRFIDTGGAVSMIWNALYSFAMTGLPEPVDYFYQVNDDLGIIDDGWAPRMISVLRTEFEDDGLVAPNDIAFGCRMLTQAMVSRSHWLRFGFLYPPDIRNWHCDNWLSGIYQRRGRARCFKDLRVRNNEGRRAGPRYQACRRFQYKPFLKHYFDAAFEP